MTSKLRKIVNKTLITGVILGGSWIIGNSYMHAFKSNELDKSFKINYEITKTDVKQNISNYNNSSKGKLYKFFIWGDYTANLESYFFNVTLNEKEKIKQNNLN